LILFDLAPKFGRLAFRSPPLLIAHSILPVDAGLESRNAGCCRPATMLRSKQAGGGPGKAVQGIEPARCRFSSHLDTNFNIPGSAIQRGRSPICVAHEPQ
jgi:hypothetical protein